MTSSPSRLQIVSVAEKLADRLLRQPHAEIKRNTFYTLVSGFLQNPDPKQFRSLLNAVPTDSDGVLARGEGYAAQVHALVPVLLDVLAHPPFPPEELRNVFGWTARLLPSDEDSGRGGGQRSSGRPVGRPGRGEGHRKTSSSRSPPQSRRCRS